MEGVPGRPAWLRIDLWNERLLQGSFAPAVGGHDVDSVGAGFGVEEFPDDFFVGSDLEDFHFLGISLAVAADDGVAVLQADHCSEFLVLGRKLVAPNGLVFPGDFLGDVSDGEEDVSVFEHVSVAGFSCDLPFDLTVFTDEDGGVAGDEEGVLDTTG